MLIYEILHAATGRWDDLYTWARGGHQRPTRCNSVIRRGHRQARTRSLAVLSMMHPMSSNLRMETARITSLHQRRLNAMQTGAPA
jgi:hypothetical protein